MIQCPEAHLFCTACMTTYAETKLGEHDARITCMDQSGCKLLFPDSELRRFLTPKLLELYERVKQRKEIEAAGLEGLEECPFCEYKVVIENEQERLFRCENEACAAVTCRKCKKLVRVNVNLCVSGFSHRRRSLLLVSLLLVPALPFLVLRCGSKHLSASPSRVRSRSLWLRLNVNMRSPAMMLLRNRS